MNEVFSFSRFCRLFMKHTAEHARTYLMSIAVLAGVLLLGGAFLFYMIPEPPELGFQAAAFAFLLVVAGTIFTSTIFSDLGERNKAIPALTLPATTLEKFLVGWLYSYPIFLLVYIGIFYLTLYGLGSTRHWSGGQHFYLLNLRYPGTPLVVLLFSLMHALALYGSIFFRKLHFIKSGFIFFIGIGVMILLNTLLLKVMTGLTTMKVSIPFGFLEFFEGDHHYSIYLVGGDSALVVYMMAVLTILVWVAAYFRLKEKQV